MKLSEILSKVFTDYSEQVAIVDGDRSLTYGQLNLSVGAMASTLSCHNWHVIPFMLESRLDAIVVMLAADRLGIPFMPIDATKTSDAIKNQLKLVHENRYVSNVYPDFKAISIDSYAVDISGDPIVQLDNQQVLSLMFTSGSTGMPKGVLVKPDSVINLLHEPSFFERRDTDVFATYSPLAFDASTFEIFGALLNGNKLVVLDKLEVADPVLLNKNIELHGITCMWFTAGLFNSLVKADQYSSLGNLRTLFVGGDRVDPDCAVQFLESGFNCELYNGYGPTENTVFTTVARLDAETIRVEKSTPIGLAVRNVDVRLMAKDGSWIDGDGEGRLYVKGDGLSLGYLNNEEANSKAFVSLGSPVEERYYDTGDKVLRKNGVHYFVGRYDRQVKVKGQRVDLNLVEDRLKELSGHENLVIYLSKATGGVIAASSRDSEDLHASIKRLSDVEQPRAVVVLPDWPLNENGKVDVKTIILLSESQLLERNEKTPVRSNNDNGHSLQSIVRDITGNNDVSLEDNLFDTGLDSISVVRFQSEIEKRFGVNIGLLDIYEAGNLLNLEQHLASKTSMDERDYYLKQTANTAPGQYAHYFKDIPLDVEQIFRISRNIVEHHAGLNS